MSDMGFCKNLNGKSQVIVLINLLAVCAQGATLTVDPNGFADYTTIQAAINAAVNGDTVIVNPGTYFENIHFSGKNIVLRSTDPNNWQVVDSTVINGRELDTVVKFSGSETQDCKLIGFTITNGKKKIWRRYLWSRFSRNN
jgi:pectin methylesterase-like acyl-CoA thioesterase